MVMPFSDLRHAVRVALKHRGFTSVAILSLALGIGANTAVFNLLNAILLRPLPARDASRLVSIYTHADNSPLFLRNSYLNYRDYRDHTRSFSGLAASSGSGLSVNLGGNGKAELVRAQMVSGNFFDVLGVTANRGRTFRYEEGEIPGAYPVAVIGDSLWHRRFGGDPSILGKPLRVNGHQLTIIGVMPRGFTGVNTLAPVELWVPTALHKIIGSDLLNAWFDSRRLGMFDIVGRLRPGVEMAQAKAEVEATANELRRLYPVENRERDARVRWTEESAIDPNDRADYVKGALLLMAVAGAILLISCVNLASFLLARSVDRRQEIAVRLALGGGRGAMMRMLITESVMLALCGGVVGLLLAVWTRGLLWSMRPPSFPANLDIDPDARVLLFTLVISVVTGVVFGLAPALQMTKVNLVPALKGAVAGTGVRVTSRKLQLVDLLTSLQVAVSMLPLIGAILCLRSLGNAQHFDPGFRIQDELVVSFDLGSIGYSESRGQQFYQAALQRIDSLPGVRSAAFAESLKLYPFGYMMHTVYLKGKGPAADAGELIRTNAVTPSYFATLDVPLRKGRLFTDADDDTHPSVAIVNETMARHAWPQQEPVGKRFYFFGYDQPIEVVGVVRNTKYQTLLEEPKSYIYLPLRQSYATPIYLHLRTSKDPAALLPAVRKTLLAMQPDLGLGTTWTLAEVFDRSLWAPRLSATLLGTFGLLALALAGMGIYGVVAYSVDRRRREIGIRMSLGANQPDVVSLLFRSGMAPVLGGLLIGVLTAFLLGRIVSGFLYGLTGTDLQTFALATALLALAAAAAALVAAHRSTRFSPLEVLKT
jgi:predicted permease